MRRARRSSRGGPRRTRRALRGPSTFAILADDLFGRTREPVRWLRLDPRPDLLQDLQPRVSRQQLGNPAQLYDGLLRKASVLGFGAKGQSLIDVRGQISNLQGGHWGISSTSIVVIITHAFCWRHLRLHPSPEREVGRRDPVAARAVELAKLAGGESRREMPGRGSRPRRRGYRFPCFPNHSKRYASSGPASPSYASCATRSANGSAYRAVLSGPASTGSKPTSRISVAATPLASWWSPQCTKLGRVVLRLASYTANSTSLGTVPNAETT